MADLLAHPRIVGAAGTSTSKGLSMRTARKLVQELHVRIDSQQPRRKPGWGQPPFSVILLRNGPPTTAAAIC